MAEYQVTDPATGTKYTIPGPEGATQEEAQSQLLNYLKTQKPAAPQPGPSATAPATYEQFRADMRNKSGANDKDIMDAWYQLTHGKPGTTAEILPPGSPGARQTQSSYEEGVLPGMIKAGPRAAIEGYQTYKSAFDPKLGPLQTIGTAASGIGQVAGAPFAPGAYLGSRVFTGIYDLTKSAAEVTDQALDEKIENARRNAPGEMVLWQNLKKLPFEERVQRTREAMGQSGSMIGGSIGPLAALRSIGRLLGIGRGAAAVEGAAAPAAAAGAPAAEAVAASTQPGVKAGEQMLLPMFEDVPKPRTPAAVSVGDYVPLHSPDVPRGQNWWSRAMSKLGRTLPQDYPMWREVPNSPAITLVEQTKYNRTQVMKDLLGNTAWYEHDNPAQWMEWEQKAVNSMRAGMPFEEAVKYFPPDAQKLIVQLRNQWSDENAAARYFRGKDIKEEPFYILPHVSSNEGEDIIKLARQYSGVSEDLRTSLGAFEKPRMHATMLEGIGKGADYIDPRTALAYRLWAGQKMILTHQMVQGMEDAGILSRSEKAAAAAAKEAGLTTKPVKVVGIPGEDVWFARSGSEARFITDELKNPHRMGSMARLVSLGNSIFRNLQLWNAVPHIVKNMFYKYGLNSGSLLRIVPDIIEYFRESNPMMKQLFDRYMPFESTGKTAQEMFHQLLGSIQGHDRIAFNNAPRLVWKAMNTPNRVSSKVIFGYADPAIKYARFKQYVNAGVSPQEAANQVHMDLIRYGMRSDAVDIWKGLAMNLFVPWRVGTVQSLYKSMRHTPVQAVLWIGAIDALREEVYRKTGWWWHLPIDYVEGPLYKLLSNHDAGTTASLAASTAAFGPGGEYTTRFWGDVFKAISSNKIDGKVLLAPLWSVATFVDPYGALFEARSYMHDGNTAHLVKLASMFALGAHDAVNYRPARLGAFIPNDVMSKAPRVLTAEAIQDRNKKIQELQQQRPPRPTIRQRVGP